MIKKISTLTTTLLLSLTALPALAAAPVAPELTCDARFDWPDDAAAHVLNGPLDGSFDYDFAGSAIDNINGDWTGWDVVFAGDHYLVDAAVTSTGSVGLDGDMKVTTTTTTTDSLGQVWSYTEQRQRKACQERRVIDSSGLALSHEGVWTAGRYDYEEQRPLSRNRALTSLIADVTGTLYADGSSEAVADYFQSGVESSTSIIVTEQRNLDGERWIQMDLSSADAARSTTTYIAADGSMTKEGYWGYDARWDYEVNVDYAGVGTGWQESGEYEEYCYLEFGADICTRSCWDMGEIEGLEDVYEDQDLEFEFEFGDYVYDLEPEVSNFCNSVLFEAYAITPY